jgi:molecular chaperone DnaJ
VGTIVAGPTHYDTLRVPPSASTAEIREAYRRLAREHHPDRSASAGASADAMPSINEAYRVLGDPARRAVYDAGLRRSVQTAATSSPPTGAPSTTSTSAPPAHSGPARFPWRGTLVAATIGVAGVVVLSQFTEPGEPPGPDGIFQLGDCAQIQADLSVREVACTGDPAVDVVVDAFVPFEGRCPGGTTPYRDRQGMGIACVTSPENDEPEGS